MDTLILFTPFTLTLHPKVKILLSFPHPDFITKL